jgi:hypothetical protein
MPRAANKANRCLGVVDPSKLYTPDACKRETGLGRPQLIEGRKAGVLKPISVGRFLYYRGSELVQWIEGHAK